jgi:signal transduction histidine kinase
LEIADDGAGYRSEAVEQTEHFGLSGMTERAAMAGGTFQAKSQPGKGTTIIASVPSAADRAQPVEKTRP